MSQVLECELPCEPVTKRCASADAKLRVVHVVLSLNVGGMERVVLHLAREGVAAGQEVSVICLQTPGVLAPLLQPLGATVIALGKEPGITPALTRKIRSVLRELRPQIMHTHQIGALLYAGPAARKERVPAVVHTEHLNHVTKARGWTQRARMRTLWWLAARNADRFFCVSPDIAESAKGLVSARKLAVVDNGIQTSVFDQANHRFDVRAGLGIAEDAPVIGVVARLNEIKCQDLLIRAFPRILLQYPKAQLLLVGDGPLRPALEVLTGTLGLTEAVHFAGYQSHPEQYLQAMDLFVLPSRLEGLPLAILEAWAARLPVIATRVGGVPKVVTDGVTGLLIDSGDQPALEAAMLRVLGDNPLARRLGTAGRSLAEANFSTQRMAATYQQHYLELLAKH